MASPGEEGGVALQQRPGAELLYKKVMPEDALRERWLSRTPSTRFNDLDLEKAKLMDGAGKALDPRITNDPRLQDRLDSAKEALEEFVEQERSIDERTPFDAFALATAEDRELYSKVSTADAQVKAIQRAKEERAKPRIGDPVGTGSPSPNAYVEIGPRRGPEEDGPEKEAVNRVVARHLRISEEKATRLVQLGAVWVYDDYYVRGWERIMKDQFVEPYDVLRVFPNPERFKTCYVEDWRDRVKKVDSDFVVVDKPPLLPCFAKVSNGRESLSQCVREALHVRSWGGTSNNVTDEFTPCHEIDDEASGLVVLARHKKAVEAFDDWLRERKVVFEFVALCTADIAKGTYRHFYERSKKKPGQPKPALYQEIPPEAIKRRQDYDEWDIVEMEVVATAPLPGGCAAVRVRTFGTGWKERVRAQLAMLGAPVLNDQAVVARGAPVPEQVVRGTGLLPERAPGGALAGRRLVPRGSGLAAAAAPLAGAVDEETLRGPYGRKLRLLPLAKEAADRGVPQTPQKKVPVALHLARVEFGGRVVTCAPPAYWPEGAAAAVAVQLTVKDIKTNVHAFLITQGGHARFGLVGGRFNVKVEWLEEHFIVERARGLVFASETAQKEWVAEQRVKTGAKSWGLGPRTRREKFKDKMMRIREKYVAPDEMGWKGNPTFKQLKKNLVKKVNS